MRFVGGFVVIPVLLCALSTSQRLVAATLDGVTLTTDYAVPSNNSVTILNGLTLSSANLVLQTNSTASFSGSQQVSGAGDILLNATSGNSSTISATAGSVLTLNSGITLRTGTGNGNVTAPIINFGTVSAETATSTLNISSLDNRNAVNVVNGSLLAATGLTNSGTIAVTNSRFDLTGPLTNTGSIQLNNATTRLLGTILSSSLTGISRTGGSVMLTGTLDNRSSTFNFDAIGPTQITGTIWGGTLIGSANSIVPVIGAPSTLDGVTLGSSFSYVGQSTTLPSSSIRSLNGLTLAAGTTFSIHPSWTGWTPIADPMGLTFVGTQTLGGSGKVVFNNLPGRLQATSGTLTIAPGVTVETGSADGIVGRSGTGLINQGTLTVTPGRTLHLLGNWSNTGTINVQPGGAVHLGGSVNLATVGTINRTGAKVFYAGAIDNTGSTFDFGTSPVGTLDMGGLVITGGTVVGSAGEISVATTLREASNPAFHSATVDADFAIAADTQLYLDESNLAGSHTRLVGTGAALSFLISAPIHVGEVIFDNPTVPYTNGLNTVIDSSVAVTLAAGSVVRTGAGGGTIGHSGTVTNYGMISSQSAGKGIDFKGLILENYGTLSVSEGLFRTANSSSSAEVRNYGQIDVSGGVAQIALGAFRNNAGATVTVSGGEFNPGKNWSNNGAISVTGGMLTLEFLPAGFGNLSVSNGAVQLLTATNTAKVKTIAASNMNLIVTAALNNNGDTIDLASGVTTLTLQSTVTGGTITGGSGYRVIVPANAIAHLAGVTLGSDLQVIAPTTAAASYHLGISGGLTLSNNAVIKVETTPGLTPQLIFSGAQTIGGSGAIVLGGTGTPFVYANSSNPLTFGSGITIRNTDAADVTLGINIAPITIQGVLSSQVAGKRITVTGTPLTNAGTFEARNGGTLSISISSTQLSNLASNTLTGGTWAVYDNSSIAVLYPTTPPTFTTNAANIILSGPNSTFAAVAPISSNPGSFSILNGRNFTTVGDLANSGTLSVGTGSTLHVTGTLTSTGTIAGGGTIDGNVISFGTISPGSSPGILEFDDDLVLQPLSALNIQIAGNVAGLHDAIHVGQTLQLDGDLIVTLDGYTPQGGDAFTIFTATTVLGQFDNVSLPAVPGGSWDTTQLGQGTLVFVPEPSISLLGVFGAAWGLRRRRRE